MIQIITTPMPQQTDDMNAFLLSTTLPTPATV